MPQVAQNVCLAAPVLNRYVVSASAPLNSSNCSGATIRCKKPFLVQTEQLHSVTRSRSALTRKRTRPQWQPPDIVSGMMAPVESARRAACIIPLSLRQRPSSPQCFSRKSLFAANSDRRRRTCVVHFARREVRPQPCSDKLSKSVQTITGVLLLPRYRNITTWSLGDLWGLIRSPAFFEKGHAQMSPGSSSNKILVAMAAAAALGIVCVSTEAFAGEVGVGGGFYGAGVHGGAFEGAGVPGGAYEASGVHGGAYEAAGVHGGAYEAAGVHGGAYG